MAARRWVAVDCSCGRRIGRVRCILGAVPVADVRRVLAAEGRWSAVLDGDARIEMGATVRLRCPGCGADTRVRIARFGRAWLAAWDGDRVMVVDPSGSVG